MCGKHREIRLSGGGGGGGGGVLLSVLTPCSTLTLFSLGQLLHSQHRSVKGAFLISLSPVHSMGLNEQGPPLPKFTSNFNNKAVLRARTDGQGQVTHQWHP